MAITYETKTLLGGEKAGQQVSMGTKKQHVSRFLGFSFFLLYTRLNHWRSQQHRNTVGEVHKNHQKSQKMRKDMTWPGQTDILYTINVLLLTNTIGNLWTYPFGQQRLRRYSDFHLHGVPQLSLHQTRREKL